MDTIRALCRGGVESTSRSWPATWCGLVRVQLVFRQWSSELTAASQIRHLDPTRAS